ncbi:MAG: RluA family pseudouridine synthase [Chloroflexota bacterium]|nr:RluA family pseudouridine synthase [Chloroflexota bacterium]
MTHREPGNIQTQAETDEREFELFDFYPERSQIGVRLDRYVASEMTDLSRTYLQTLIDEGQVLVDGQSRRAAFKITPGQHVTVAIPETTEVEIEAQDLPLDILYSDDDVVVINKPAGLVVHPAPGHPRGTLVNGLLYHFPEISIAGSTRPGIVHRLDKDTSGVMIVAKTDRAQTSLVEQWQGRSVEKQYKALVSGVIEEEEATIEAPIGRDPANRLRMAAVRSGKDAISHFTVDRRYKDASLLDVRIETGRTHQIRVHLAMIGAPVLGDRLYSTPKSRGISSEHDIERHFLHATSLTVDLPNGQRTTFEAPLANDLVAVLDRLDHPVDGGS